MTAKKKKTTQKDQAEAEAVANPPASESAPAQLTAKKPAAPARYVWQRLWFQWVLGLIVFFLFLSFVIPPIYYLLTAVSGILTPVLLGLGLAYIFNPLVTWCERRYGLPRPASAALMLILVALVVLGSIAAMIKPAIEQSNTLVENAPEYAETVLGWMNVEADEAQTRIEGWITGFDWTSINTGAIRKTLGVSAGVVFSGLSLLGYFVMAGIVTSFCFFFFTWKFEPLKAWFVPLIPTTYRKETLRILGMMDQTVSAIIRGRLIQSLCVMVVLCIGWWIAGVPYWLLLGVLGGLLNLLPYAAIAAWPLAVGLAVIDAATGGGIGMALVWAAVWPTLVYLIAQSLDGWVVEPLVQGKATGMDPLTVLLVVLAGGALLGILGMILAIPAAACIKILSQEVLLPKARAFAADPPDLTQKGSA
ncbi:AI-2E family transporter [Phycisphaeraceae bacterium D3-23]